MDRGTIAGAATAALGVTLFLSGFKANKNYNIVRNTPTSKCRSAAMGIIELYGKAVKKDKELISPFSKQKCFYYNYKIEEYRPTGKNYRWVTVESGEESVEFYIEDDTGRIVVSPKGAQTIINRTYYKTTSGSSTPEIDRIIEARNIKKRGPLEIKKKIRYTEYCLREGDDLYVLGYAGKNPHASENAQTNQEKIMIKKGPNKEPYIISNKKEDGLIKTLKWQRIGGLIGGVVLIVIGLGVFLISIGVV